MGGAGGTIGTPITTLAEAGLSSLHVMALELFRREFSMHPWHFWGLAGDAIPVTSSCNDLVAQYAWQSVDRAGRVEIAHAIESAFDKLAFHLGYAPAPRYTQKVLPWPRYHDMRVSRYPYADARGQWVGVSVGERYVQACGVEALTVINASAAVAYSDRDGDGLNETFTVTTPTTVTDPSQIAVYFAAADRLSNDLSEWRVQPVQVSIASGAVTITGPAWLLVKPVKYEGVSVDDDGIDPAVAGNLATTLSVYRRSTYQAGTTLSDCQSKLIWESQPWPGCCTSTGSDAAAEGYAVGRCGIRDSKLGIVVPAEAVYSTATGLWAAPGACGCEREPDRVLVRYLAGFPLTGGQPDRALTRTLMRLAAAELGRPICACEWANKEIARWQVDLARTGGNNDDQYAAVSPDDLNNPLGTRRGQVEAWKFVQREAISPTTLF